MTQQIFYTDFKTLRQAYQEVKTFLEEETCDKVLSLNTKLEEDLGCAGDDNLELLEKFVTEYKLDVTGFDYSKHFLSEGELFNSGAVLLALLGLPIVIILWLIKVLSLGKIDWTQKQFFPDFNRKTSDLTFADMLTWYLMGKYTLHKDVQFKLQNTSCTL